jgi:membrane protein YqaA with SNARE-associated domain
MSGIVQSLHWYAQHPWLTAVTAIVGAVLGAFIPLAIDLILKRRRLQQTKDR